MAKNTFNIALFRVTLDIGRVTWVADLAFGLVIVLLLAGEGRAVEAGAWWATLAVCAGGRGAFCHWMRGRLATAQAEPRIAAAYTALAALEGCAWAAVLALLPASAPASALLQVTITMAALLASIAAFAPMGLAWGARAVPVAAAQAMFLVVQDVPSREASLLAWALALAGAVLVARWLRGTLTALVAARAATEQSARVCQDAAATLSRWRERLGLTLAATDAGIADVDLVTGERYFSARYHEILGYRDLDSFLREHSFSESIHPEDRERVRLARRAHVAGGAPLREECRMRGADGNYVSVMLRGASLRGADGRATRLVLSIVDDTGRRGAEQRLAESEARYRALVEASPSLIWVCDGRGRLTFVSDRAARELFGYDPREVLGRHVWEFNAREFSRREFLRRFASVLHGRPLFDTEAVLQSKRGELLHLSISALPTVNAAGAIECVTGVCSDITAVKQRERELNVAMRNQQAIFDAAGEGIAFVKRGRIDNANGALARMLGVTRESLLGQPVAEILANRSDWDTIEHTTSAAGIRGDAAIHEVMLSATDGRTVWCQLTAREAGDGQTRILVLTDITALKRREELAWHQANHDDLTGLPNRRLLVEHARRLLSVALRQRRQAAVMVLDLDGFKEVNDLFGHAYGDALLRRVAQRLSGVLRDYDVVARTGGDEFVVLLPEIEQLSVAVIVAEKLIAAASESLEVPGRSVRLHASVGVALFPGDGHDFDALIASADAAMYAAKAAGKNRYQFASELTIGRS